MQDGSDSESKDDKAVDVPGNVQPQWGGRELPKGVGADGATATRAARKTRGKGGETSSQRRQSGWEFCNTVRWVGGEAGEAELGWISGGGLGWVWVWVGLG